MANPWFLAWFWLNVGVTLLNKTFFSTLKAPYPAAVTFVHMVVSGGAAYALLTALSERYNVKEPNERAKRRVVAMSFLFVANILVGNASLSYCSIAFVQMVRCTIPAFTAALSYIVLGSRLGSHQTLALFPIIVGAALVCYGEIYLTPMGLMLTLLGCVLSAAKTVLTKMFLSGTDNIHPFVLLEYVSLLGAVELTPIIYLSESKFYEEWLPAQSVLVLALLLLHGFFAFMLNIANFEANRSTNPLLITVGGNAKSVVTVFLGIFLFRVPVTPTFVVGATITFAGVFMYSQAKPEPRPAAARASPAAVQMAPSPAPRSDGTRFGVSAAGLA